MLHYINALVANGGSRGGVRSVGHQRQGRCRKRAMEKREVGRDDEDGRKRIYGGCRGKQHDSFLID